MAKIYPTTTMCNSNMSGSSLSGKETYTIWTKSLIFHGNGCTIYNSKGVIVYRVDNYDVKNSKEVQLMDLDGNVLFSLKGKRWCGSGSWYGYKGVSTKEMPWFHARGTKIGGVFNRSPIRECKVVIMGCGDEEIVGNIGSYRIEGTSGKAGFRILDGGGGVVAEVRKKESWGGCGGGGVLLGDDVLTLEVEPDVDHSLVMALVIVYGLMTNII